MCIAWLRLTARLPILLSMGKSVILNVVMGGGMLLAVIVSFVLVKWIAGKRGHRGKIFDDIITFFFFGAPVTTEAGLQRRGVRGRIANFLFDLFLGVIFTSTFFMQIYFIVKIVEYIN